MALTMPKHRTLLCFAHCPSPSTRSLSTWMNFCLSPPTFRMVVPRQQITPSTCSFRKAESRSPLCATHCSNLAFAIWMDFRTSTITRSTRSSASACRSVSEPIRPVAPAIRMVFTALSQCRLSRSSRGMWSFQGEDAIRWWPWLTNPILGQL